VLSDTCPWIYGFTARSFLSSLRIAFFLFIVIVSLLESAFRIREIDSRGRKAEAFGLLRRYINGSLRNSV
jgi:hypothetical protein